MRFFKLLSILIGLSLFTSCVSEATVAPISNVKHAEWTQKAIIYEVNLRQYTKEGTIEAFEEHLPRLAELGVDILWFMPVHPIGVLDRKGELGSYYSISDFKGVNSEFGGIEDFKRMVKKAHDLGLKVILDWVANHSSRDHEWITTNPDWYIKDSTGRILAPFDWTDVAKLDYSNQDMRDAMLDALKFWVEECDVDGYRCDVASEVPTDFWDWAFADLRAIDSSLFFLAEAENPELMINAFDAYYGWEMHHNMNKLATGKMTIAELNAFLERHAERFPASSIAMYFTSNHDENSWNGTEFERMGDAVRQLAAFSFAIPGMPLIYSGQEVGLDYRLEFFKRDPINWETPFDSKKWGEKNFTEFYKDLIALRDAHPAMYAPTTGAPMTVLATSAPEQIFAFERVLPNDHFTALFNFSKESVTFSLNNKEFTLPAHGYKFIFN